MMCDAFLTVLHLLMLIICFLVYEDLLIIVICKIVII